MIQHVTTASKKGLENGGASVNHVVKEVAGAGDATGHGNPIALSCFQHYDSRYWIIDSGASDHICFDKMSFNTLTEVKPISVKLTNGIIIKTCYVGTVRITQTILLTHVLFVPEFTYNLVSVNKLAREHDVDVIFGKFHCFVQEVQTKRRISLGSLQPDELYHLVVSSSSSTCVSIQHSSISEINDFSHIIPPGALWHFSWFVWVVLFNNKGEVQQQVKNFITLVRTQFGQTVKAIRSDNGPEFLLPAFYSAQGIVHQRSCSQLPKKMWRYSVLHDVFLMNRIPSKLLKIKSPYELLYREVVDMEMMKAESTGDKLNVAPETQSVERDESESPSASIEDVAHNEITSNASIEIPGTQIVYEIPEPGSIIVEGEVEVRRSTRPLKRPVHLANFQYSSLPTCSSTTHSSIHHYSNERLSIAHKTYALNIAQDQEPSTFAEANKDLHWHEAMQKNLKHLREMLDVDNAFLHGKLDEDVYMNTPAGVPSIKPNQVCKLLKSLYGLKQASRKRYEKLSAHLEALGFTKTASDHSLFVKYQGSSFTNLLVYVDDVILFGNTMTEFQSVKDSLHPAFGIKDLGVLKYFLGLEDLSQRFNFRYIKQQVKSGAIAAVSSVGKDARAIQMLIGQDTQIQGGLFQAIVSTSSLDLKVTCTATPVLLCDNQSALHIAANLVFHEKTKHLDIDCHVVREKLQGGILKLLPIPTALQVADVFTVTSRSDD
ncbi:uncharacterized protein LOC130742831 [Lotus japonicus]|uniref:uncharacterized protein LOC130742831 n=1 Tax=Lotus japonicus TaxID=34305 RepID=UPI00258F0C56|nr:uncharacterized protein LOC130742831 [Lotus japonicus]